MKKYKCSVCGYVYNPSNGDSDGGIAPNTPFDKLPEDWTCPVCRVDKSAFVELQEDNVAPMKETKIEENVNISNYDDNSDCGSCEI